MWGENKIFSNNNRLWNFPSESFQPWEACMLWICFWGDECDAMHTELWLSPGPFSIAPPPHAFYSHISLIWLPWCGHKLHPSHAHPLCLPGRTLFVPCRTVPECIVPVTTMTCTPPGMHIVTGQFSGISRGCMWGHTPVHPSLKCLCKWFVLYLAYLFYTTTASSKHASTFT